MHQKCHDLFDSKVSSIFEIRCKSISHFLQVISESWHGPSMGWQGLLGEALLLDAGRESCQPPGCRGHLFLPVRDGSKETQRNLLHKQSGRVHQNHDHTHLEPIESSKPWRFMYGAGLRYAMCHTNQSLSLWNYFLPLIDGSKVTLRSLFHQQSGQVHQNHDHSQSRYSFSE